MPSLHDRTNEELREIASMFHKEYGAPVPGDRVLVLQKDDAYYCLLDRGVLLDTQLWVVFDTPAYHGDGHWSVPAHYLIKDIWREI